MAHECILRILLLFISSMDQEIKTIGTRIALHYGLKLLFVEQYHRLNCFTERIQEAPAFIAIYKRFVRLSVRIILPISLFHIRLTRPPANPIASYFPFHSPADQGVPCVSIT